MGILAKIVGRMDVSALKFKRKAKEKPSLLKDVMENPERFKLEAFIENDEIIVKIRKRES